MTNQNKYQFKGKMMKKQNLYSKADDEVSDFDEDEENSDLDRNEILFLEMENQHHHEESNEKTTVVDLEAELVAALEEIENLRDINKKQTREYVTAKRQLATDLKEDLIKKENEINDLQEQLKKSDMLTRKFEKSSVDLNNLINQQRDFGDKSGIGFEESKVECSKDQEVRSLRDKLVKHRKELRKIRQSLEEASKLLIDREKESE